MKISASRSQSAAGRGRREVGDLAFALGRAGCDALFGLADDQRRGDADQTQHRHRDRRAARRQTRRCRARLRRPRGWRCDSPTGRSRPLRPVGDSSVASMRNASSAMSCVADEKATSSGEDHEPPQVDLRVVVRHREQARHDPDLRQQHPRAPPAEPAREERERHAIDDRRPDELDRVGDADPAHEADRGQADAGLAQPRRQRREDQQEGQPGREAQEQEA